VIIPDVNVLLYAEIAAFAEHPKAKKWWEKLLGSGDEVGLPPPALFGFVRIATNPRVFTPALGVDAALGVVEAWLAQPNVRVLVPGPRHLEIAFRLLRGLGVAGNLTTDVQLAAYAIENTATLCSNDSDFARFGGLAWKNPIA
jgi:uncharacterized protein